MAGRLEEHRRVLGVKERALHPAQLQRGRFLPLLPPVHVVLEDAEPPLEPPHPPLRLVDGLADLAQHLRAAAPLCRTSAASRCPRRRRDRHRLPSRRLEEPAPPALQRGPEVAARLRSLRAGRRRLLLLAAVPPALRLLEPSSLELGEKEAEMREVDAAVASSSDGRRGCLRSRRAAGAGAARQRHGQVVGHLPDVHDGEVALLAARHKIARAPPVRVRRDRLHAPARVALHLVARDVANAAAWREEVGDAPQLLLEEDAGVGRAQRKADRLAALRVSRQLHPARRVAAECHACGQRHRVDALRQPHEEAAPGTSAARERVSDLEHQPNLGQLHRADEPLQPLGRSRPVVHWRRCLH
mmetsp:Transcript_20572/g.64272  ORF Transcript_20572/g.64272 Transcript_20572/m.64272 type:complete len:357 (+) Transcript_20572:286-1356(+)